MGCQARVLGSIPENGVPIVLLFFLKNLCNNEIFFANKTGPKLDSMGGGSISPRVILRA